MDLVQEGLERAHKIADCRQLLVGRAPLIGLSPAERLKHFLCGHLPRHGDSLARRLRAAVTFKARRRRTTRQDIFFSSSRLMNAILS